MATISSDGFSWNLRAAPPASPAKLPASVVVDPAELAKRQAAWQQVIDQQLIEWGRDPSELVDEGLIAPSGDVIRAACDWARSHVQDHPPTRVAPTTDGGIVFELETTSRLETVEFSAEGQIEYTVFDGQRTIVRERIG